MMTKVTYLLHARADEDLRSGPLTTTDTRLHWRSVEYAGRL